MELQLILCDIHAATVAAWRREFAGCPHVSVWHGDLLDIDADAYVSPANSYGPMDGGIDWDLRERFGHEIEDRVRDAVAERGGRLPVGEAVVVETHDEDVPYLISAPTMEVPSRVADTDHAYRAMRALLRVAEAFSRANSDALERIAVPGLCTGTGGMDPDVAARQMRRAYEDHVTERSSSQHQRP